MPEKALAALIEEIAEGLKGHRMGVRRLLPELRAALGPSQDDRLARLEAAVESLDFSAAAEILSEIAGERNGTRGMS